jgi:phage/plasmid-associated DNA primase
MPKFEVEKAIMNRIIVIPFNNTFETNITFESKMLEKRDFIFSFIMKFGVIQDKFDLTEEMINAKECYKNDNVKIDYLQDFIDKHYKIVPFIKKEKIERDNFRSCYNEFLKTKGQSYDISSNQKFTRLIREKNIGVKESHGKTYYTGLIVNMDDETALDEDSDEE